MGKTFGSGDSATQKKVNNSAFTTDITVAGATPSLTIGDAGEEDSKIVFDGAAQDYYIGLDDTDDDLKIGKGSAVGTTTAISIDENLNVTVGSALTTTTTATVGTDLTVTGGDITYGNAQNATVGITATAHNAAGKTLSISTGTTTAGITDNIAGGSLTLSGGQGKGSGAGGDIVFQVANAATSGNSLNALAPALTISDDKSLTIGNATAEDTKIVFDGNAHDFQIVLDDSEDQLQFQVDTSAKAFIHSDVLVGLSSGNATQTPGFGYLPNYITWAADTDLTLTPDLSGSTIVMTNAGGDVILPAGGTVNYGMQFVVINATTSNNANAVQRSGSSDSFFDSDTTGGETGAQAIAAMKAKTFIYFATNKWLVIG